MTHVGMKKLNPFVITLKNIILTRLPDEASLFRSPTLLPKVGHSQS